MRHASPNRPVSSRLRVFKNYCFELTEYYGIPLKHGAETSNLVVEYGSVYLRSK